jgi:putative peptidoglycan lipid II flippase
VFVLAGGAGGWMAASQLLAAVGAVVIGVVCLIVYVGLLALLRAPELGPALEILRRVTRR